MCAICVEMKTCRHRSGRATGCNSLEQPFQYHGLLNRLSQCLPSEPANVDSLDRSLKLSPCLRQEFGNFGASLTLSLIQSTTLVATY